MQLQRWQHKGNRPHEKTCWFKDTFGAIELTPWFEPDLTD